jgi:hypothetical protein
MIPHPLSKVEFKVRGCLCCSHQVWYLLFFCKVSTAFHIITRRSIQSFSWEANGYSSGQKIPLEWNPMIHYHIYRGPSLSHTSPVCSLSPYILTVILILSCYPRLCLLSDPDRSGQNFIYISHFSHVRYIFASATCFSIVTLTPDLTQLVKMLLKLCNGKSQKWLVLEIICRWTYSTMGRDSSVGTATAYGLDGSRIESRWGWDFLHLSRPALRPTQPPVQWVPGLSWG